MTGAVPPTPGKRGTTLATSAAGAAAAGALACAACCVLPFALPAAVLAVTGGALAWLASIHQGVTVAAIALVAAGWVWVVLTAGPHEKVPRYRNRAGDARDLGDAGPCLFLAGDRAHRSRRVHRSIADQTVPDAWRKEND